MVRVLSLLCVTIVCVMFCVCVIFTISVLIKFHNSCRLQTNQPNLVPRAFSSTIFKMADRREKTLAHSRIHVTDLPTEDGNLFKMAAKIKSERIWIRGRETSEKQTKWWQRQTRMARMRV